MVRVLKPGGTLVIACWCQVRGGCASHVPAPSPNCVGVGRVAHCAPLTAASLFAPLQREGTPQAPLSDQEKKELQFLYDEWAHPYFISIQEFGRIMEGTGQLEGVNFDDWTQQTLPSWWHSIYVGAVDPSFVLSRPQAWGRTARDMLGLVRMHGAFDKGLMQYGMMAATKRC
jgi:MPBQ/MSBQ methyltransferase